MVSDSDCGPVKIFVKIAVDTQRHVPGRRIVCFLVSSLRHGWGRASKTSSLENGKLLGISVDWLLLLYKN